MKKIIPLVIILMISNSGCGWLWKNKPLEEKPIPFVEEGLIIKKDLLQQGGTLYLDPFSAGEGAEATEELDRVALGIVKGIAESLREKEAPFTILIDDVSDEASFILKGRIEELKQSGGIGKWLFRKPKIALKVKGQIIDKTNGDIVLKFTHQRQNKDRGENMDTLSVNLGQDIGNYIVWGMK